MRLALQDPDPAALLARLDAILGGLERLEIQMLGLVNSQRLEAKKVVQDERG